MWENINKDKPGKNCNDQQKRFSLFVISVGGMLGKEALFLLSRLSRVIAKKREEPIFQVRGWVDGRITIAIARSYSWMIRRAPHQQEPDWDPELGIRISG